MRLAQCVVSQYVNKGCSLSWNVMLHHFDQLVESTFQSLDVTGADPENIIKVIKEVVCGDVHEG